MTGDPPELIAAPDGTPIAAFVSGTGPPLVLVHGTTADHTTWRVVGPMFAASRTVVAIDRRGRGASGDTEPYDIVREEEDVAAVIGWVDRELGGPVAALGHSYGGRCVLGAALQAPALDRIVVYEGPVAEDSFGRTDVVAAELDRLLAEGRPEAVLETFMRQVVRTSDEDWAAFLASETYPLRVAAAHTIVRELRSGITDPAELERFRDVRAPVLQVLGGASDPRFRAAASALTRVLPDTRTVVIDGARHAAHHTHPDRFVAEVLAFTSP